MLSASSVVTEKQISLEVVEVLFILLSSTMMGINVAGTQCRNEFNRWIFEHANTDTENMDRK